MNQSNLPTSDSIQELSQFWDSHDLTDFEAELEEVQEQVFDIAAAKRRPSDSPGRSPG
jgi:hypothetical protein